MGLTQNHAKSPCIQPLRYSGLYTRDGTNYEAKTADLFKQLKLSLPSLLCGSHIDGKFNYG